MNGEDIKTISIHLARVDQATVDIKETNERQEKALVEIFRSHKEMNAAIASLNTVIRMNIAEQKRINRDVDKDICNIKNNWKNKENQTDGRMRSTERRIAYFAGGAAVALIIFDLAIRFISMWILNKPS